ncbi:hypothetical protein CRM22_007342 [Opisthorchis felineus]|uniref:Uncharacterized protein n=1 Tax=Opisthorchis felineus TaxID=147828 RepID=A0A4S2LIG5_OPIFE|nr:hypothetical protein CRM22_007342 [Opisthorchis felineus]
MTLVTPLSLPRPQLWQVQPTSASRLLLPPGSIPALVFLSGGMAARHRKGVTTERSLIPDGYRLVVEMNPKSSDAAVTRNHWHNTFYNYFEAEARRILFPHPLLNSFPPILVTILQLLGVKSLTFNPKNEVCERCLLASAKQQLSENLDHTLPRAATSRQSADQNYDDTIRKTFMSKILTVFTSQDHKSLNLSTAFAHAESLELAKNEHLIHEDSQPVKSRLMFLSVLQNQPFHARPLKVQYLPYPSPFCGGALHRRCKFSAKCSPNLVGKRATSKSFGVQVQRQPTSVSNPLSSPTCSGLPLQALTVLEVLRVSY